MSMIRVLLCLTLISPFVFSRETRHEAEDVIATLLTDLLEAKLATNVNLESSLAEELSDDCFVAVPKNECPFHFKNIKPCASNLKNGEICEYVRKYRTDPDPKARARNCHRHNVFRYVCGTCYDRSKRCPELKPGVCTSPLHRRYVKIYCRKTCGFCDNSEVVASDIWDFQKPKKSIIAANMMGQFNTQLKRLRHGKFFDFVKKKFG